MLCLQGVPDVPREPPDEAGLMRTRGALTDVSEVTSLGDAGTPMTITAACFRAPTLRR